MTEDEIVKVENEMDEQIVKDTNEEYIKDTCFEEEVKNIKTKIEDDEIKKEFEISIGIERNEDESVKLPLDENHLMELIRLNIEHNINLFLPFCCKMIGDEIKKEMDKIKLERDELKKELYDKTHENIKHKLKIEELNDELTSFCIDNLPDSSDEDDNQDMGNFIVYEKTGGASGLGNDI